MPALLTQKTKSSPRWRLTDDAEFAAAQQRINLLNTRQAELQRELHELTEAGRDKAEEAQRNAELADRILAGDDIAQAKSPQDTRAAEIRQQLKIIADELAKTEPYTDGGCGFNDLRTAAGVRVRRKAEPERRKLLKRIRVSAGELLEALRDELNFCNELEAGQLTADGRPFMPATLGRSRGATIEMLTTWIQQYDETAFLQD